MFNSVVAPIVSLLNQLMGPLLAVVGAAGALYCVLLGVKFAQAAEPQDREKAKGALKNAIIGFVLIFVLVLSLNLLMPTMIRWVNQQAGGTVIAENAVGGAIAGKNTSPNQPVTTAQPAQTETPAPQTETPAPQTETPAPQAETPAPQAETPAPQTETPAPQTETPAPQAETPAPQTETPAPQTETPAPQTETPRTHTDAERYELAHKTGGLMRSLIRTKANDAGGADKLSDDDAVFIRDNYLSDRTLTPDDVRAIAKLICDPDGLDNNGLFDNQPF